jgi:hypothetical protein
MTHCQALRNVCTARSADLTICSADGSTTTNVFFRRGRALRDITSCMRYFGFITVLRIFTMIKVIVGTKYGCTKYGISLRECALRFNVPDCLHVPAIPMHTLTLQIYLRKTL